MRVITLNHKVLWVKGSSLLGQCIFLTFENYVFTIRDRIFVSKEVWQINVDGLVFAVVPGQQLVAKEGFTRFDEIDQNRDPHYICFITIHGVRNR